VRQSVAILRYNPQSLSYGQVENYLTYTIDTVGEKLAEILTDYLRANQVETPSGTRTITPNSNMVTELQLDSFQVMEFMLEVEDHFDIAIDLERLSNTQTIGDLAAVVIAARTE